MLFLLENILKLIGEISIEFRNTFCGTLNSHLKKNHNKDLELHLFIYIRWKPARWVQNSVPGEKNEIIDRPW